MERPMMPPPMIWERISVCFICSCVGTVMAVTRGAFSVICEKKDGYVFVMRLSLSGTRNNESHVDERIENG